MKQLYIFIFFLNIKVYSQVKKTTINMDKNIHQQELIIFDTYYKKHYERVKEITTIPKTPIIDNYSKLDNHNIENKIFKPFSQEIISKTEILNILENLDENLIASFAHYAKISPLKSIKGDTLTIKSISDILKRKNQSNLNILYFKATNNYENAFPEIEKIIYDHEFLNNSEINIGYLLSRYAYYKEESKSLKLLEIVVKNINHNTEIGTSYSEIPSVFEQLIFSENSRIRIETEKLLIDYFYKNPFCDTYYFHNSLKRISSDHSKIYLKSRIENIFTDKEKKYFNSNLLRHYTKLFGYTSFPYLKENLALIQEQIKFDTSYNEFRFLEYSNEVVFREHLEALVILAQNNKLTESQEQTIISFLDEIQLTKIGSYYWREYVEIIKAFYPTVTISSIKDKFRSTDFEKVQNYWNQRIYNVNDIDDYLTVLNSFGFSKHLNSKEKQKYILSNLEDKREVIIWDLLKKTKIAYSYDSESGFYPPNYNSILTEYLNFCKSDINKLKYEISYEKLNSDKTKSKLFLSDNSKKLEIETNDNGDWYDYVAIDAIYNKFLMTKKIKKRFISVITGDQSRLLLYCTTEQSLNIQNKFGLQIEYKIKQE